MRSCGSSPDVKPDDLHVGVELPDAPRRLHAVHARHLEVHDDQVDRPVRRALDGLLPAARLLDDLDALEVGLEHRAQEPAEAVVVVDEREPHVRSVPLRIGGETVDELEQRGRDRGRRDQQPGGQAVTLGQVLDAQAGGAAQQLPGGDSPRA